MWKKACQLHIFLSLEKTDCQLHTKTCQSAPSATLHRTSRETCFIMPQLHHVVPVCALLSLSVFTAKSQSNKLLFFLESTNHRLITRSKNAFPQSPITLIFPLLSLQSILISIVTLVSLYMMYTPWLHSTTTNRIPVTITFY